MRLPKPDSVYKRIVENPKAAIKARIEALNRMTRCPLAMLYRLVSNPATPTKLYTVAAAKYEYEMARKELRKHGREQSPANS